MVMTGSKAIGFRYIGVLTTRAAHVTRHGIVTTVTPCLSTNSIKCAVTVIPEGGAVGVVW
jgi:hypothetical protein